MTDKQTGLGQHLGDDSGSRISSVPLLGEGLRSASDANDLGELDTKTGKRRFWQLGKKKEDEKAKKKAEATSANIPATVATKNMRPVSPVMAAGIPTKSTTSHPYGMPSSPSRGLSSSSPGPPSPASSQIFERSVQEDGLAATASPAIPAHINTENHIPPALDASSIAITDDHLNPDNVEIVMHSAHQPAAVTVTGAGTSDALGALWQDDMINHPDIDDTASNYGALDSNDVRRLSFISFADVVHAEHSDHPGSVAPSISSPLAASVSHNRSPSPVRSPLSSQGLGGSPIGSGSESSRGLETSPNRSGRGPTSSFPGHSPPTGGELTIETMRQALRKTGSGDLSGARSQPLSAVGGEDGVVEPPFKET
ncbi:hypothetical protein MMC21_001775 [Puttea exsequens]|nr:hypothetical protein [Puttea exsequens]